MIKIEAVVIRERIETVIDAVEETAGHVGVTVIEAVGHGVQRGITHEYRGRVFESRFLPKALMTFIVTDELAERVLETVADQQMRAFARTKAPGDIMDRGVWAWSRHPNYLGELGFWWGLFLFGVAADPAAWWWTLSGPLAMTCMFLFASIPLLDGRSVERRPGYAEYMQRVPALLPFPRRVRPGSSEGAAADT